MRVTYTSATMAFFKVNLHEPSTYRSKEPTASKHSTNPNNL